MSGAIPTAAAPVPAQPATGASPPAAVPGGASSTVNPYDAVIQQGMATWRGGQLASESNPYDALIAAGAAQYADEGSGLWANLKAGLEEGVAFLQSGMPANSIFGLLAHETGITTPEQQMAHDLRERASKIKASSLPEHIARGVGASLAGGPFGIEETAPIAIAKGVGEAALAGAGSGAGEWAGETVAPPGWKAFGGTVGGLVGGLGAGAFGAALSKGTRSATALARGDAGAPAAVERLTNAATTPDLPAKVATMASPAFSGDRPTLPDLIPDVGLSYVQKDLRTGPNSKLISEAQNERTGARYAALQGVENKNAQPADAGTLFTNQLADIDNAHQAVVTTARENATQALGATGNPVSAADAAGAARSAIAGIAEPQMAEADAAENAARDYLGNAFAQLGSGPDSAEARGALARQVIQQSDAQRHAAAGRLFDVVRQHGDVTFDGTGVGQAAQGLVQDLRPEAGDELTALDAPLVEALSAWNGPVTLDQLQAARRNITGDLESARRSSAPGAAQATRRLTILRGAVDDALEKGISSTAQQEQQAVADGQLDPDATLAADLHRFEARVAAQARAHQLATRARERQSGTALADSSAGAGYDAGTRLASISGVHRAESSGAGDGGPDDASGNPGVAPGEGLPVSPEEAAAEYAAARQGYRDYRSVFGNGTPTEAVLKPGPYGAGWHVPDSAVVHQYFRPGAAPENIDNLIAAVGTEQAENIIAGDAAASLRAAARTPDGTLNRPAYRTWMKHYSAQLAKLPDLAARYATPADAQAQLDEATGRRTALASQFGVYDKLSDAGLVGKAFRAGPEGAQSIKDFREAVSDDPVAMTKLQDYIATEMQKATVRDGQVKPALLANWKRRYDSALSELPDLSARIDNAADAENALLEAEGRHAEALADFRRSAAGMWLNTDPAKAAGAVLGSRDSVRLAGELAGRVAGDPAAQAGLRRAFLDQVIAKAVPGAESGEASEVRFRPQVFLDILKNNRQALAKIFTPQQMDRLDRIGTSLRQEQHTLDMSKTPLGPGTARDLLAQQAMRPRRSMLGMVLSAIGKEGGTVAGGVEAGFGGAYIARKGIEQFGRFLDRLHEMRQATIEKQMARMITDPEYARLMFMRYDPRTVKSVTDRMLGSLMRAAPVVGNADHARQGY